MIQKEQNVCFKGLKLLKNHETLCNHFNYLTLGYLLLGYKAVRLFDFRLIGLLFKFRLICH